MRIDDQSRCPAGTASVSDVKLESLTNPGASGGKGYLFNKLGYTASNPGDLRDVFIFGLTAGQSRPVTASL